jgi:ABC-2 type transport system ATP-binding protein
MSTVRVQNLHHQFGGVRVFDGFELSLDTGVTGLLGPNGAGKTTLLRCLATALAPDRGDLRVLGYDPANTGQRTEIRRKLGYLPQDPGMYPHFTAFELVDYVAVLKEITDRRHRHREVRRVLAEVDLGQQERTKVRKLSGGMRQRLALAQALLGDPQLLILDEPTVGLDPEQRMRLRALVSRLGESRTVLLSTHQTEDVTALCGRVVVLRAGRVAFDGTPSGLAGLAAGQLWLSASAPTTGQLYWRTAEGRYRSLGGRPDDAVPAEPSVEDGYLTLVGERTEQPA